MKQFWSHLIILLSDTNNDEIENMIFFRYSEFLTFFSNNQYCRFYLLLLFSNVFEHRFSAWNQFFKKCLKINFIMSAILHHIIFWFSSEFKKLTTLAKEIAEFKWQHVVHNEMIKHQKYEYMKLIRNILNTKITRVFIKNIWNIMISNYAALTNAFIKIWICHFFLSFLSSQMHVTDDLTDLFLM